MTPEIEIKPAPALETCYRCRMRPTSARISLSCIRFDSLFSPLIFAVSWWYDRWVSAVIFGSAFKSISIHFSGRVYSCKCKELRRVYVLLFAVHMKLCHIHEYVAGQRDSWDTQLDKALFLFILVIESSRNSCAHKKAKSKLEITVMSMSFYGSFHAEYS